MPRPVIFISAVGKELQSTRYIVANALTALGYEPKWHEIADSGEEDPKAAIRSAVDGSLALLQIVGHFHGPGSAEPDEEYATLSYTHYEASYAQKKGKPVRYILLGKSYPADCEESESPELQKRQAEYRAQVETKEGLFHRSASRSSTEKIVQTLCEDFTRLRRRSRQRVAISFALIIAVSCIIWAVQKQVKTAATGNSPPKITEKQPTRGKAASTIPPLTPMEKALIGLADAESRSSIPGEKLTLEEIRSRAYTLLETELGMKPGTLAAELPGFALERHSNPDTGLIQKAAAAYALNHFEEAEALFLEKQDAKIIAKDEPSMTEDEIRTKRIQALEGAAQFATAQIQYARALEHYRAAAALTSMERNPLEWARIHHMLAYALTYSGLFSDAEQTLREVVSVYKKQLGAEHPATLSSSNNLANALNAQGKYAEAEELHRSVLGIRLRLFGLENPDALTSRNNLAASLNHQGKHDKAEVQQRAVLEVRERTLGSGHPDTLFIRNNLAKTLTAQGNHKEAEAQYRAVLAAAENSLGGEHPDTLTARSNLARSLRSQGGHAEAEEQYRTILAIRERVLGSDHFDVFTTCHSLALSLASQDKNSEALIFAKRALDGFTKSLGAESPYAKASGKLVALLESREQSHPAPDKPHGEPIQGE